MSRDIYVIHGGVWRGVGDATSLYLQLWESSLLLFSLGWWVLALSASGWRGAVAQRAHRLWLGLCRSAGTGASSRLDPGQMLEHDSAVLACTCGVIERLHTSLYWDWRLFLWSAEQNQGVKSHVWPTGYMPMLPSSMETLWDCGLWCDELQGTTLLFPADSRCGNAAGIPPKRFF